MRLLVLPLLALLASCAASPTDLRPPQGEAEKREVQQLANKFEHVGQALRKGNLDICRPPACTLNIMIGVTGNVGAFAGEGNIYLSTGLLRAVQNDHELALILGHEWAHLLLPHHTVGSPTVAKENEADCVGALLAARAGFDVKTGNAAMRRIIGGLENRQMAGNVAMAMLFGIVMTGQGAHDAASKRADRIDQIAWNVSMGRSLGQQIDRATIRSACGVAP